MTPHLSAWRAALTRAVGGSAFLARHSLAAARHTARHATRATAYFLGGGAVALLLVTVVHLNDRPDLSPWHETRLREEFTASTRIDSLAGYLDLEDRLFEELDRKIYRAGESAGEAAAERSVNRYQSGSLADPRGAGQDWNRTFELVPPAPGPGVLLLHGMSDSPYSLRALAEALHARGARVLGLRLPGHGTAPSGLVSVEWEDMLAAVLIGARHLRGQGGGQPLYLVGYSHGGALAIRYALASLEDDSLPPPGGVVLISPAIGVTSMAALAVWQGRLGDWLGLDKLAWVSILPEYDPFKYVSFAVNAGHQTRRLTVEISRELDRLSASGKLDRFPRVLAFQSAVDATVSTPALVEGLLARLPSNGHELVLFDLNRIAQIELLMHEDPTGQIAALAKAPGQPFSVSLVTNRDAGSAAVEIRRSDPPEAEITTSPLPGLAWPAGVYSLSHISLPFPPDDPLYGGLPRAGDAPDSVYRLGNIALRGERGVLRVSPGDQLRLRWNPFYRYLEERTLEFAGPSAP